MAGVEAQLLIQAGFDAHESAQTGFDAQRLNQAGSHARGSEGRPRRRQSKHCIPSKRIVA